MGTGQRVSTVLIVDDDLGFVYWLGEIVKVAGCDAVPALSCRQAVSLVRILDLDIDLIVVNPALDGVAEMVQTLSRARQPKIVVLRDPEVEPVNSIFADATWQRPSTGNPAPREEWVGRIRMLLPKLKVCG